MPPFVIGHLLDDTQKAERVPSGQLMLKALNDHVRTNHQYFLTGNELRVRYDQMASKIWVLDRDHFDAILCTTHCL
jgi:hypothetical protein